MDTEYTGPDTVHKQWITVEPFDLLGDPSGISVVSSRGHRWVDGSKTDFIIEITIATDGQFENRLEEDQTTISFTAGLAINNPVTIFTMAPTVKFGGTIYSSILATLGNEIVTFRAFPFIGLSEYDIKIQGHYRTLGNV